MRLRTDPNYGLHKNIERFRASLHKHPSKAQLILYEVLDELGVKYEPEFILKPDRLRPDSQSRYILDAALPDLKLDFEVDGWWHYNDERIMKRDIVRDATLKLNGWKVVRIPGSSIYNHAEDIKQLVSAHLRNLEMTNDKRWVRVLDARRTGQVTTVYGFECIPSHTYVADGILVHNCLFCQNHAISKETDVYGEDVPPEQVPRLAAENDCEGVGFSYNEPTIFVEYVIDTAREAHRKGKYAVFVTNGYGTVEIGPGHQGIRRRRRGRLQGERGGALPEAADDDGQRRAHQRDPIGAEGPEDTHGADRPDHPAGRRGPRRGEEALQLACTTTSDQTSRSSSQDSIQTTRC